VDLSRPPIGMVWEVVRIKLRQEPEDGGCDRPGAAVPAGPRVPTVDAHPGDDRDALTTLEVDARVADAAENLRRLSFVAARRLGDESGERFNKVL
jgi:hypothetical protein